MIKRFLLLFLSWLAAVPVRAETQGAALTGLEFGTVAITEGKKTTNYSFGGVPLNLGLVFEPTQSIVSYRCSLGLLLDAPNSQLSRMSLDFETHFSLLGGQWRRRDVSGPITQISHNFHSLAAVFKVSYSSYHATSINNDDVVIKGSVLETRIGLSYRQEWSNDLSFEALVETTALSFQSSETRIEPKMVAILLGPRWLF